MNRPFDIFKKTLRLSLFLFFTSGCTNYMQIYHLTYNPVTTDNHYANNPFKFVNDTLTIGFDVWDENGLLVNYIENKVDKPIYIDWKRSSLIVNNIKLNFWEDQSDAYTSEYYKGFLYANINSNSILRGYAEMQSISSTKIFKPERITFIPPKSIFPKSSFKLKTDHSIILDSYEVSNIEKKKLYFKNYDYDHSPYRYRLFLTYSNSETIVNENYVDISFYVSKIENVPIRIFDAQRGKFEAQNRFYHYLPKGQKAIKELTFKKRIDPNRFADPIYD